MKNIAILSVLATLLSVSSTCANDLDAFGLGQIEPLTEEQSNQVRGQGLDSVSMSTFQIFAFDPVSGSSINLQSASLNSTLGLQISGFEVEPLVTSSSYASMSATGVSINDFVLQTLDLDIGATGAAYYLGTDLFEPHFDE